MVDIKLVIGANFGDCGKGLMADYFCHQAISDGKECVNVLHNGGAQRGHTVVTPDGTRHVFHHFGSGTFAGADTYCTEDFILNPIVFRKEYEELEKLGYTPHITMNEKCRVSTPYDMIMNQIVEENRSNSRHGSCGMGIYETIQRYKNGFGIDLGSMCGDLGRRLQQMRDLRDFYYTKRIKDLGLTMSEEWENVYYSYSLLENYMRDFEFMLSHILIADYHILQTYYHTIVFEGGQGLLLDQNNKEYFPHLTPSNTGSTNPYRIISERFSDSKNIEICYVTRTYLTRHGAGRLDGECSKEEINPDMQDLTNVPNPHQGTLRYAKLDVRSLGDRIAKDFERMKNFDAKYSIAVTHCNEYPNRIPEEIDIDTDYFGGFYTSDADGRDSVKKMERDD